MAQAVQMLREALDEFRSRPRRRAGLLRVAMEALKAALPSAFDPEHEKKNGDEEAARELYDKCEKELQNIASAQATPTPKRERGAESTEAKSERPEKKHKTAALSTKEPQVPEEVAPMGEDAMVVDEDCDPFEWSVDDVVKWAVEYVGVSRKNANKLREQEIDGAHLPDLTAEMMVKLCGISAAAAVDIMNHLPDLFPSTPIADAPAIEPVAFNSIAALVASLSANSWKFLRDLRNDIDVNRLPRFHSRHKLPDISRDREIAAVIELLSERSESRSQADGSVEVRELNRYIATQGGPGTGKSYLLWKLSTLSPEHYPDAANFIKQWIPIPISYNQTTSFSPATYDAEVIIGFALRLLYSFLFDAPVIDALQFNKFAEWATPTFRRIGLVSLCTEILKFVCETAARSNPERRRPLLLIDEIMKVGPGLINNELLHEICDIIDWDEMVVDVVITALSIEYLVEKQIKSGRSIDFIPLRRLNWDELITSLLALPKHQDLLADPLAKSDFVKLIADCCGHPRTARFAVAFWTKTTPRSYSSVLAQLLKLQQFLRPGSDAVRAAIKADAIAVKESLPDSDDPRTFDALVCDGVFVNSFEEIDAQNPMAVPRLSAIQLWKWLTPAESKLETDHQRALRMLLEVDANSTKFDGYSFEYFMLQWECLTQRPVFQHTCATSILGRYLRTPATKLTRSLRDVNSLVQFGGKEITYIGDPITEDLCTDRYSLGHLYYVGKSNPGFDYFYRERTTDGKDILILVEVKFSDIKTEDEQLLTMEVNERMAYCARALEGRSGEYSPIDYHKVYVMFLAMRSNATKSLVEMPLVMDGTTAVPLRLAPNISYTPLDNRLVGFVLNRDMMKTLIGDTLFYRAMFSLEPY